jgi:SAM-dependent methyltransferase
VPQAPEPDDTTRTALVRDGYDAIAERYLRLASETPDSHPRRRQTAALLDRLAADASVIELGCGAGVPIAAEIVSRGHRYTGVDISPRQIELACEVVPGGSFIVGDALDQRFAANSFDAALMLYAITHVPRRRWNSLARQIHTWLAPDGFFLVNVPQEGNSGWLEEDFLGFGTTNWTNAYGASECADLLKRVGFEIVEAQTYADDEPDEPGWVWILARKLTSDSLLASSL